MMMLKKDHRSEPTDVLLNAGTEDVPPSRGNDAGLIFAAYLWPHGPWWKHSYCMPGKYLNSLAIVFLYLTRKIDNAITFFGILFFKFGTGTCLAQ